MAGSSLGHIAGTVSLNIDPFTDSIKSLEKRTKSGTKALKALEIGAKANGNSIRSLRSLYSGYAQQLNVVEASMKRYKGVIDAQGAGTKKLNNLTEQQKQKINNATKSYNQAAAESARLKARMSELDSVITQQSSKLTILSDRAKQTGAAFKAMSTPLKSFGSTMTMGVTAPIVAGFGYAAKSAIDFNSQIQEIGPLLTNGAAVTGKYKTQLDAMASSSKKWSTEYGVSTKSINNGMGELVRRGYDANKTMGAMPSILNATKASGEEFGTVMQSTTSILEQFGLNQGNIVKNTGRVTDSLTYAANATAASFGDMSEAMKYVGPVAHSAGMSLESTAAAIGLMSNAGIEGEKAGTGIRSILTSLVRPSKNASAAFQSMGLSASKLKKDSNNLPQLIDDIKEGTKGWTDAERNHAIAQAFGTQGQTAMNALLEQGSGKLRKMTKEVENSGGATKKVADSMNNLPANKIKQFQQALNVLAIEVGQKLLPALLPTVQWLTNFADKLANMDSSTLNSAIKMGMFLAVLGPTSSALGHITGAIGSTANGFGILLAGMQRASQTTGVANRALALLGVSARAAGTETRAIGAGVDLAGNAMSNAGGKTTVFGSMLAKARGSMVTMAGEAGVLGTSLTPVGAAVLGVTAAVGAGIFIWDNWGKAAVDSAIRTGKWGSDVGASADKSLTKFQNFTSQSSAALQTWSTSGKNSAKNVGEAFDGMAKQIDADAKKANKSLTDSLSKLPPSVQALVQAGVEQTEKANNKAAESAKKSATTVQQIMKNSAKNHYKLTLDEANLVNSAQQNMTNKELSILGIGGAKKKNIIKAMNGDVKGMTQQQLSENQMMISNSLDKENKQYQNQKKILKDMYDSGAINSKTYQTALKAEQNQHKATSNSMIQGLYNTMKAEGMSTAEMKSYFKQQLGLDWGAVAKALKKPATAADEASATTIQATAKMSQATQNAVNKWNGLVYDPKTGKVKTNAVEEISKAMKSSDGWKQMKLAIKEAPVHSNASATFAAAAIQAGKWDKLSLNEKKAIVRDEATAKLIGPLSQAGVWNSLSMPAKQAIVEAKGQADLQISLERMGQWNSLPINVKNMIAKDAASQVVNGVKVKVDTWNAMPTAVKQLITHDMTAKDVKTAIKSQSDWDALPSKIKKLIVNSADGRQAIKSAGVDLSSYEGKKPKTKKLNVDASNAKKNANSAKDAVDSYNNKKPKEKKLKADNSQVKSAVRGAQSSIDGLHGKTVTIKMVTEKSTVKKNARGNRNFEGGLTWLGDGGRAEPFMTPDGGFGVSPADWTLFDLPRGTRIWSSVSKMMSDIPTYASGTANNAAALAKLLRLPKAIDNSQSSTTIINNESTNNTASQLGGVVEMMAKILSAIQSGHDIVMDGRKVGKTIEPDISQRQLLNNLLEERGVFNG